MRGFAPQPQPKGDNCPCLRFQPAEPLAFVKECVSEGRLRWTYHVASRLGQRALTPQMLVDAFRTFEILES
jgi:hypothetical protein